MIKKIKKPFYFKDEIPSEDGLGRTLLFLSCWDNGMYIYDMNYNRCIFSLCNAHDDAVSRVRVIQLSSSGRLKHFKLVATSGWDSLIKIWLLPLRSAKMSGHGNGNQTIKTKFLCELAHDASIVDFELSESYLASICDDGNLCLWSFDKQQILRSEKLDTKHLYDEEDSDEVSDEPSSSQEDKSGQSCFGFLCGIQSSAKFGKITDCKIVEACSSQQANLSTVAVCTSLGFIKIYNIQTNCEIFSIRLDLPVDLRSTCVKLNKLFYTSDYILAVDQGGFLYFIDLQQVNAEAATSGNQLQNSFLAHTIRLTNNQSLHSLCIYREAIICAGDSDGTLYFLSLIDI